MVHNLEGRVLARVYAEDADVLASIGTSNSTGGGSDDCLSCTDPTADNSSPLSEAATSESIPDSGGGGGGWDPFYRDPFDDDWWY
jgi:hypothetical protein